MQKPGDRNPQAQSPSALEAHWPRVGLQPTLAPGLRILIRRQERTYHEAEREHWSSKSLGTEIPRLRAQVRSKRTGPESAFSRLWLLACEFSFAGRSEPITRLKENIGLAKAWGQKSPGSEPKCARSALAQSRPSADFGSWPANSHSQAGANLSQSLQIPIRRLKGEQQ